MRQQPPSEVVPSDLLRLQPVSILVSHRRQCKWRFQFRPKLILRFAQNITVFKDGGCRAGKHVNFPDSFRGSRRTPVVTLPPDLKVAPTPCLVAALGRTGSQLELEPKVSEGLQSCTLLLLLLMSYAVVNLIGMSRAFLTPLYRSSCCVKFAIPSWPCQILDLLSFTVRGASVFGNDTKRCVTYLRQSRIVCRLFALDCPRTCVPRTHDFRSRVATTEQTGRKCSA